jgi:hypothetical protein
MLDSVRGVVAIMQSDDQEVQDTDTYSSCVRADTHVGTVPVMAFVVTWSSLIHTQTTATHQVT